MRFLSIDGRAGRREFWSVHFGIGFVQTLLTATPPPLTLRLIVGAISLCIAVAVGVRRLHDRDKSGWWLLLVLVPILGILWSLVELGFCPATRGANRYGPAER
jgi:uncharacterized membrane protein YhaH (DUF805 family)